MIHTAVHSPKFRKLTRRLRPFIDSSAICEVTQVVGILDRLWHMAISGARRGDIGKYDNEEIAEGVGWKQDADALVNALTETGWLDPCAEHRLVVHDWAEHAPRFIKQNIKRMGGFITGDVEPEPTVAAETERDVKLPPSVSVVHAARRKEATPNPTEPNPTEPNPTEPNPSRQTASTGVDGASVSMQTQPAEVPAKVPAKAPAKVTAKVPAEVRRFDAFWAVVHLRVGKQAARKALAKAVAFLAGERSISHDAAAEFITESMKRFAGTPDANPNDRSPIHPTTWLNEGRYEDDITPSAVARRSRPSRSILVERARRALIRDDGIDDARNWPDDKVIEEYQRRLGS